MAVSMKDELCQFTQAGSGYSSFFLGGISGDGCSGRGSLSGVISGRLCGRYGSGVLSGFISGLCGAGCSGVFVGLLMRIICGR